MANDFNDIDQLFRNQFEDYKDHSVNPSSQWSAFEALLDAEKPVQISKGAGVIKYISNFKKPLAIAARAALLIAAGFYSVTNNSYEKRNSKAYVLNEKSENVTKLNSATNTYSGANTSSTSSINAFVTSNNVLDNIFIKSEDGAPKFSDTKELITSAKTPQQIERDAIGSSSIFKSSILDRESEKIKDKTAYMPTIGFKIANANHLFDENRQLEQSEFVSESALAGETFLRIGVRFGNGESNNTQVTNFWAANALASIGYKKPLRAGIGLMTELTYLRRSGNGLERNQNLEVDRLYTAFNNSVNPVSPDATPSFTVDRSIVATRLDYIQLPLAAYYEPYRKSEISGGVYADLLLHAKNETYLVYNQKDYVARQPDTEELKSLEGLNRIRFGLSAGAKYEIMKNVSLDLKALLPLNSAFNKTAAICASQQANQSIDFYLSLKYTL